MPKYPNHGGYSKMPTAGCGGSIIMIILTALCPPLVIIFWAIYSAFDSSSQDTKDILQNIIAILIVGFVLIGAPVVTTISFFMFGIEETLSESWFLVLISLVEIIVIWHIIIKNYQNKKMLENETPEEREIRLEKEKAQQKEYEEQLKFKRLNTPTDHNNSKHVCNIYLYDKFSEELKSEQRMKILRYISQGINLSQPTWEVYYYRMVENNPDFPPKDKK